MSPFPEGDQIAAIKNACYPRILKGSAPDVQRYNIARLAEGIGAKKFRFGKTNLTQIVGIDGSLTVSGGIILPSVFPGVWTNVNLANLVPSEEAFYTEHVGEVMANFGVRIMYKESCIQIFHSEDSTLLHTVRFGLGNKPTPPELMTLGALSLLPYNLASNVDRDGLVILCRQANTTLLPVGAAIPDSKDPDYSLHVLRGYDIRNFIRLSAKNDDKPVALIYDDHSPLWNVTV